MVQIEIRRFCWSLMILDPLYLKFKLRLTLRRNTSRITSIGPNQKRILKIKFQFPNLLQHELQFFGNTSNFSESKTNFCFIQPLCFRICNIHMEKEQPNITVQNPCPKNLPEQKKSFKISSFLFFFHCPLIRLESSISLAVFIAYHLMRGSVKKSLNPFFFNNF